MPKFGQILNALYESGAKISKLRQIRLASQEVYQILESVRDKPNFK